MPMPRSIDRRSAPLLECANERDRKLWVVCRCHAVIGTSHLLSGMVLIALRSARLALETKFSQDARNVLVPGRLVSGRQRACLYQVITANKAQVPVNQDTTSYSRLGCDTNVHRQRLYFYRYNSL
jgi:hypothetical protein